MADRKFVTGDKVYVAKHKGRDVAEYVFIGYSMDYPDYATVSLMAHDKEHTMLIRLEALYRTHSMAASVKRTQPERVRRGAVPHPYWLLPKRDYKQSDM